MEELIVVVFQFVIEFTLNVLGHLPIDWPSKNRKTPEREGLWALCFVWHQEPGVLAGYFLAWHEDSWKRIDTGGGFRFQPIRK